MLSALVGGGKFHHTPHGLGVGAALWLPVTEALPAYPRNAAFVLIGGFWQIGAGCRLAVRLHDFFPSFAEDVPQAPRQARPCLAHGNHS